MNLEKLTFSALLEEMASEYGDRPALTTGQQTLSFRQLKEAADTAALAFIKLGMKPGERVVLWGVNGNEWMAAFYGIVQAGGVAVLMNYGLKAEEVTALARQVDAAWCVIGGNLISQEDPKKAAAAAAAAGVPVEHILPVSAFAWTPEKEPLSPEAAKMLEAVKASVDPKDARVIIYTTGTTSAPKAVQLSSYAILSDALGVARLLGADISDTLCVALPLFHSYGFTAGQTYLMLGKHVFLTPLLKPDIIRDMIDLYHIQDITSVGAIYGMLTRLPDFAEKIAGKLKLCIVGGGFTTPMEMMRLEKAFDGGKILCGYGLTECSPIISVERPDSPLENRARSVGFVPDNIEVKLWNAGTGFVGQGEIGEILVKGPNVMNGYYGLPAEKQPFDEDGWLHTGDLGRFAEDGMLQFAGRIKDIIIRSGENISPTEIEQVLLQEPYIREAKVLGAPHPMWGESVEACLVLEADTLDEDLLRLSLRQKLSSYKIPSHFLLYDAFPLNANGKLDQRGLKASMLQRLQEMAVAAALDEGLRILDLRLQNKSYAIVPASAMVEELAGQLGFERAKAERIRLSVEEMLTDRIDNAYDEKGEIRLEVILMPQWLRLRFRDTGKAYRLDAEDASISAKIILANVDNFYSAEGESAETEYWLDYQYRDDFDVKGYLLRHGAK